MADRLDGGGLLYLWQRLKTLLGTFSVSTGTISSLPKEISDSRIDESTVVLNEYIYSDLDIGWVTVSGKVILYGNLPSGETKPAARLWLQKVNGVTAEAITVNLRLVISPSADGNYLEAEAYNLIPGVQYTFRLYKVISGGTDENVYSMGTITGYPQRNAWFQEVPRELEDGESYYVTVAPTIGESTPAESNTVTFVGGENVPAEEENE